MRYLVLVLLAGAFGVEEAIVVVYLRHLPATAALEAYHLELARELCTLVVLGAVAALAGSRTGDRLCYFFFTFGTWDIVYYLGLWQLSGYPSLADNDVLFLIPVPWIAPVWAAVSFAAALTLVGLFGIAPQRGWGLAAGLALGWVSFVYQTAAGMFSGRPLSAQALTETNRFPIWLFVAALACVVAVLPFRIPKGGA